MIAVVSLPDHVVIMQRFTNF